MHEADVNAIVVVVRGAVVGVVDLIIIEGVVEVIFVVSWGQKPRHTGGIRFESF
jgi:hypothetical protein